MDKRLLLIIPVFILSVTGNTNARDRTQLPDGSGIITSVQSLNVENGLPQGYVNGLLQDSTGFIWLGTRDGLARYDGYKVKAFHNDPGDSSTIASDVIQTIYPDRENRIWILYENQAVDIFDPVTERIRHIRADGPLGWLLIGREYRPFTLQQDSKGKYWVVSPGMRLLRYFTSENPDPVNIPVPGIEQIIALREGMDGEMYVCTDHSFYRVKDDRLHKISDLPQQRAARNDRISGMVQDKEGNWVIMNNDQLEILGSGGDWEVIDVPYSAYPTPVYHIDRSSGGDIYFNSANRVFRLNPDHSLSLVWTNSDRPGNIPAMMIDRSNVLWVGTNTFGARLVNLSFGGFHSYTYRKGFVPDVLKWRFHISYPEQYKQNMDPYLLRYAYDRKGRCWVIGPPFNYTGSPAGENRRRMFRVADKKYAAAVPADDSLHWLQVTFDQDDNCWGIILDQQRDTVLVKTDLVTGITTPARAWTPAFDVIGYITAFHDKLCVVYDRGIELYDPATGESRVYKSKEVFGNVKLLMARSDPANPAVLWITSLGYGLIRFNTGNDSVRTFTIKDGIPSNSVYAAVPDERGNLWCSSNKGIFRFNPVSHKVLSFVAEDGLQGNEFNRYHFLRSPDGYIFFGGTRGWTAFHPDSVHVDAYQPATVITDILVNNAPLMQIREWRDSAVTGIHTLELNYDQNFITFTFAGLQFSNAGKLQYRYQLKGLDENWIEVGNQHIANYTNLPPGEYIFTVNSSNEAGIWSPHVKTFTLVIHPPWWNTWWAYILYAFILISCGYALYRYQINRLRARRQMALQQEEAKHLRVMDEMKTRFFSNITHEFRTPLSLIIAPLEQINKEAETPHSIRKMVTGIQRNAGQLLRLINQLLDMSKMEAGNMEISLSRGDLSLFVGDNLKGFYAQARSKNIQLGFDYNLQGEHDFDADKWQKILFNLLSNAIKFTPAGGVVNVSLIAGANDNISETVILEVKDSGIGIPADKCASVFNRFYQVNDSQTRVSGGTGIGLALTKELTELMNGTITVESEPGKGTLFRVLIPVERASGKERIPLERALVSAVYEATGKEMEEPGPLPGEGAPLILLVEDNEDLNQFIAHTLDRTYRVITAHNGMEGLLKARESLPDLIISDVMMPKMNGYDLCEELKKSVATEHIAFILLSAKASHDSVLKGLENHADDYITKPFHVDELLLRIHNLIERQRKLQRYYNRQLTAPGEQLDSKTIPNLFLRQLYKVIDEYLDDTELDVGKLAKKMAVSRRTLNRKLSMLVNLSANEVIRQYRLKKAVSLLQSGLNVSETAYRVGFTSDSYFSKSFKDFYGAAPSVHVNETLK